ncbi:MAG: T9SS type A sorting domain-containing protein [Bacteroidota bacterium]|nr:T9SS type A sorting domain-containing protein [Bacteroidota bacterium]
MNRIVLLIVIITSSFISEIFAQNFSFNQIKNESRQNGFFSFKDRFEKWRNTHNFKKIKGWKRYKRWEWLMQTRINYDGTYTGVQNLFYETNRLNEIKKNKQDNDKSDWESIGPVDVVESTDSCTTIGLGRINCIAFHPKDSNIIWVGASNGGVWKSKDGGKNWQAQTDNLPVLRISDIAVDPQHPDTIYISTGDIDYYFLDALVMGRATPMGVGIYKSTDGGIKWNPTGLSFNMSNYNGSVFRRTLINSQNSQKLVAAGSGGVWISEDGGENWQNTNNGIVMDIDMDPFNNNVLYATTTFSQDTNKTGKAGIMKSEDFGKSWYYLNTNIPEKDKVLRIELSISSSNTNILYAVACDENEGFYGLYRSNNAGKTWSLQSYRQSVPNILGWGTDNIQGGQGTYDLTLLTDPFDTNTIYVGGINLWGSNDGGIKWQLITYVSDDLGKTIHTDQHAILFNPLNKKYYACNDGGVFYTSKPELVPIDTVNKYANSKKVKIFNTSWTNIIGGLAITEFYRIGTSKNNPDYIIAGSQDNSTFLNNNGIWKHVIGGDGMEAFIHPINKRISFGTMYYGYLYKSTNGGNSYDLIDYDIINSHDNGSWVTPFLIDPIKSNIIYAGFSELWKSTNSGNSWQQMTLFNDFLETRALAVSPVYPDYIYIAKDGDIRNFQSGAIYRSINGGVEWEDISQGLPINKQLITYIAVNDNNPDKVWVSLSGFTDGQKVYLTQDGGKTWLNKSKGLPNVSINCIVNQDGSENHVVYVGTDIGVYYINNNLNEWVPYSNNLPNVIVNELEINYTSQKIYAATYGRGLWKSGLYEPSINAGLNNPENNISDFAIYPNPSKGLFNIRLRNYIKETLSYNIYDLNGKKLLAGLLNTNNNEYFDVNASKLTSGIYIIEVKGLNFNKFNKLVIN